MKADILELLKNICDTMGIQALYLTPPYANLSQLDFGLGSRLYADFDYSAIFCDIEKNCQPNTIYIQDNTFGMYYTFFHFPQKFQEESGYSLCSIGPMLFSNFDVIDFHAIMEQHHIDDRYFHDIQTFFSQIPTLPSPDYWTNLITPLCRAMFQGDFSLTWNRTDEESLVSVNLDSFLKDDKPDLSTETIEKRYAAENAMLQAVRRGDYAEAVVQHSHFMQYKILPRVSDSLRNAKNFLFVANTLFRKTVEQANVHPIYIDDLSRRFAIQIENCTSQNQINQLGNDMIRRYCLLVNNYSRGDVSELIHRCLDYIDFHYAEPLSLGILAEHLSVSTVYLSALFKKEMHTNLSSYIQDVRLRQALLLLNSTKLPIQEIAAQCGFLDENYFSRVFKKMHGMSPREYRKQVRSL